MEEEDSVPKSGLMPVKQYLIHQVKLSQSAPPVQPYRKSSSGLSQGSRESNSGYQGFPWCSSAWGLFGPLRLSGICPDYWSSFPSSVTYSVERLVLHWAKCHIFRDSLAYLCVHCQLPCNVTYIQHLESCLCRVDVAPLRPLRSNELFRHHTHLHRGVGKTAIINIAIRGVGYHKHCHQGSR